MQESNKHAVSNAAKIQVFFRIGVSFSLHIFCAFFLKFIFFSNSISLQKFRVLPEDFSIYGGELGPTLKLRRKVVMAKYADIIDEMYDDPRLNPQPEPPAYPQAQAKEVRISVLDCCIKTE